MTQDHPIKSPRKLIEVALPLDKINEESARRKRKAPKGYPTTLHKWWAQRPTAAARAVIFGQLVNDPSWKWELEHPGEIPPGHLKASWAKSRKRLFSILEDVIQWDNSTNKEILDRAHLEIVRSWSETCELNKSHPDAKELFDPERLPGLCDPFSGSGTIPMEGVRLGLSAFGTDLNPVAVLISKASVEVVRRFVGREPIGPANTDEKERDLIAQDWARSTGLAEDVRRYGHWLYERAKEKIGNLYPLIEITGKMAKDRPDLKPLVGKKVAPVAYLWARTVRSPNPAFSHVHVPLVSTFLLSSKDRRSAYIDPIVKNDSYRFTVRLGKPPAEHGQGTKVGRGGNFQCLLSRVPIAVDYIRDEGKAGRLGCRLLAIVAESPAGRIYLDPPAEVEEVALKVKPTWRPEVPINHNPRDIRCQLYGLNTYADLYSPRQLMAVSTFTEMIAEVREKVEMDARAAGLGEDARGLEAGGAGAKAYAEAISLYLAFAVDRVADYGSTIATWRPKDNAMRSSLANQAIPITWDYAEGSPFASSSAGLMDSISVVADAIEFLPHQAPGKVTQAAAQSQDRTKCAISTDPPYYNNIAYADLSDFFYVWLRRSLRSIFPELLATVAVPKAEELVATPYRHGSNENAEAFFMNGMTEAMRRLAVQAHPALPMTIYYAFKQSETEAEGATASTGWETFLEAVHRAGLAVTGTWPMSTESDNRQVGIDANALASSIILVCRPRPADAPTTSRRAFLRELNQALPEALDEMTRGAEGAPSPVAPVDLSQAIIGPGMAIFSKYSAVLDADGAPMNVRAALKLINRFLAEDDFDADTQFCLHWFEEQGWKEGPYGKADVLARAKATSVKGVAEAGAVASGGGKVRLLKFSEYPTDWNPREDKRLAVWEVLHHLIRALKQDGESGAGKVFAEVRSKAESARQLAYRLYTLCERQGWAEDARAYNELITSWSAIEAAAGESRIEEQPTLFGEKQ